MGYQDKPGNQDSKRNKRNWESKENQGKKVYQGKPENKGNLGNQPEALCHLLHFRASLSPSLSPRASFVRLDMLSFLMSPSGQIIFRKNTDFFLI